MMKKDPGLVVLAAVLCISVVCTAGFAGWYVQSLRRVIGLQAQVAKITENRARIQLLVAEAMEYSKRNPAIDPILQSFNLKVRPVGALPAQPNAARPPGR